MFGQLRFYFAIFFARCTALVLKLIGRKGTSMPGSWAIILCPDFLERIPKPKTILGITGTNGKTTVSNIIEDVLEDLGYSFVCNREGTNVHTGVASSLIAESRFWGKPKRDLAIFELDERSSPRILPYIKPDMLLVTNIFRDSYKRNAHTEFILDILNEYIPDTTRLILNGDDLLCSSVKPHNERVLFGIPRRDGETAERKNIVMDITACPVCGKELSWEFIRYHHIGRAYCEGCGFTSPELDYTVENIDEERKEITVKSAEKEYVYPLLNSSLINIYNSLSAITFLREFGISEDEIAEKMAALSINETRYNETEANGKKIILHLAKGQNPVACSRSFENVRNYPGKKAVILLLDDYLDAKKSVENIAWYYDTDFEFLNSPDISRIVTAGARHWDVYVRLLMAGVPEERIVHIKNENNAAKMLDIDDVESVFVLYDVYTVELADVIKDEIITRISGEKTDEN